MSNYRGDDLQVDNYYKAIDDFSNFGLNFELNRTFINILNRFNNETTGYIEIDISLNSKKT